jgi:hypothetical protein
MFLWVDVSHRRCRRRGEGGIAGSERGEVRTVIEPIPKLVEAMLDQVLGCTEIEPWIDCIIPLANCPFHPPALVH